MSLLFGTNNYVYIPYNVGFDTITGPLTITCWVSLQTNGSMQMFVNRATSATSGNEWWSLNLINQQLRGLIGNASSVIAVSAVSPVTLVLNTWYHCALTYDGTNIKLYQDGALIGSGTSSIVFGADTTGVVVGANAQSAGDTNFQEFLLGYLEDLRLYNRALTQSEIESIQRCEGRDYIYNGLVLKLALDENQSGQVASGVGSIKDSSGRSMHGTPYGSCVYGPAFKNLKRTANTL